MRSIPCHGCRLPAGALAIALAACGPAPAPPPPAAAPAPPAFEGRYAHGTRQLEIARRDDGYWLQIHDDGASACAFDAAALRLDDRLLASLQDWKSGAVLTVRPGDDGGVEVFSEQEDDRFSLAAFCRGGATLSGSYRPIAR